MFLLSPTWRPSLVRVRYEEEAHVTDLDRQRDTAFALQSPANPAENPFAPPKPRGAPEQAFAAASARHRGEYYVPIEHHNPMELYASTVIFEGDVKLTIYDKIQGVQNVQRYVRSVLEMNPDDVRVMSPFVGGAFGSGLRPQFQVVLAVLAARALKRSVRLVLTRQQMYVLGYRPAMIQQIELGANARGRLDVITHDAVTMTSQYEDFHRQETGWSGLLYKSAHAKYIHKLARLDLATPCDMRVQAPRRVSTRSNARWTNSRSPSSSIRSSFACGVIRIATGTPTGRTAAKACAIAIARVRKLSVGTSATPSRARCTTARSWWAGAWRRASGKRCRCRSPCASC
ncbi:MAG TPA: molybdopterin cofactor-binding domain-containing protein [Stellaceae bacterium]|nr:molybdopterin cofactor-binding domain-containing protein [Stellaceae bacterium]